MSRKENSNNIPKISIVIPSLNKGNFIESTLASIFSQSYRNFEVIIQDGGSSDQTLDVVNNYLKKYPDMIRCESKKDKGQFSAINAGMRKARGEVLTYINADDLYKRDAFKKVVEGYLNCKDALWLAGYGRMVDKNGKNIAGLSMFYKRLLTCINSYRLLLMVNYLMQPSVFLTRAAYKKFGPFKGTKDFVLEYEMWLKIGRTKMPRIINSDLSSFRMSGENISSKKYKDLLDSDMKVLRKYTANRITLTLHRVHNSVRSMIVNTL
ncbi:MAG: Glycosyl transferase family 2 [Candidatus Woesebacteria bacterium GW2011_GWA2_40_7b]|uniref:Glycosyl transferase family 2 n=1 Tax=Candidatus Woesebacteria bacterium GW2011_GWA2_40_7b TaxID=1618563 RepID=A0A0G0T2Z7_9BACT|nr:MAG: Glycosyl transferase family 2 [Candidatus Woesebacteria bacterium GW2011_GWA2_40_7b]